VPFLKIVQQAGIFQVATEALSALRTVQAYNANDQEERKFHDRVNNVLALARKESLATAIFYGSTGWSGNVTLLALLGCGASAAVKKVRHFDPNAN